MLLGTKRVGNQRKPSLMIFFGKGVQQKMVLVVDLFAGVGDRLVAFLKSLVQRGAGTAMPMAFMYAAESREFFYSIALVRLMQEAARMFNNEEIFVEGFAPLPHQPAAWTGKAPDLSSFVAELRKKMKVTTIDDAGNLLIPQATDIPFVITPQLQAELQKLALQFPRPIKNQIKDITPPVEEKPQCTMLKSMDELKTNSPSLGNVRSQHSRLLWSQNRKNCL